jgi:hypothetical protein
LGFHVFDGLLSVPFFQRVACNEHVLKIQYFSHDYFHFICRLIVLALNKVVILEQFGDSLVELNQSLGNLVLSNVNFECALFFQVDQLLNVGVVGLQQSQVTLDLS